MKFLQHKIERQRLQIDQPTPHKEPEGHVHPDFRHWIYPNSLDNHYRVPRGDQLRLDEGLMGSEICENWFYLKRSPAQSR